MKCVDDTSGGKEGWGWVLYILQVDMLGLCRYVLILTLWFLVVRLLCSVIEQLRLGYAVFDCLQ